VEEEKVSEGKGMCFSRDRQMSSTEKRTPSNRSELMAWKNFKNIGAERE